MLRLSVGRIGAGAGIAAVAALAAYLGVSGPAVFAEDNSQGTTPAVSEYATGLNNPRGLNFGPDGNLWVAESGMGAEEIGPDTPVVPGEGGPEGGGDLYIGYTGAFTKIQNGEVVRVYTGLPSIAAEDGSEASGPSDVSFHHDGTARGIIGLGADPAERDALIPGIKFGYLGVVNSSGEITGEFDISAFEGEINPDFGLVDSNPNGVLAANNGGTYVVDAGANALLYVNSDGEINITATFVSRLVDTPPFLPQPPFGPQVPMESVPTSATFGPDGAIYVSELTGFPFPEGEAGIWRVEPGEPATVYMTGFTNIIDIVFDGEGNLYVLEIDTTGLATEAPGDGALWMVPAEGGEPQMVLGPDTLFAPGGVTIGPDGDLYVTNNGILAGQGQVLRIDLSGDDGENGDNGENGEEQTIVDIAVADGRFTTLVTALEAAGLVETLSGEGPYTVFAPTDDAFNALPEGTVEDLLSDIPTLTDILTYHVVDGEVTAEEVAELESATTLQGSDVEITVEDGAVMIGDAEVIITDIQASNGIIHVIDAVLMPPSES